MPEDCQLSFVSWPGALASAARPAKKIPVVITSANLRVDQEARRFGWAKSGCIGQTLLDAALDGKLKNPGASLQSGAHGPAPPAVQHPTLLNTTSLAVE